MTHLTRRNSSTRRGFTLVELLVVIAIIGTLVGLLLPAINAARERARQATCTNNLSELGKAMNSYATSGKGVFPGWVQLQKLNPDPSVVDGYSRTSANDIEVSWAAKLLPHLDQQALWDSLLAGKLSYSDDLSDRTKPDDIQQVEIFICPSNPPLRAGAPVLTYVANTGAPDVIPNSSRPQSDYAANGICHNLLSDPDMKGPKVRFGTSDIKDGASTTLLLSENVNKNETDRTSPVVLNTSWLRSSALYLGPATGEQPFGMVWVYDSTGDPLNPAPAFQERINRNITNAINFADPVIGSRFARPASEHPEMVLTVFVGGNTRSIREDIDYRVYQQLLTPNGSHSTWPANPTVDFEVAVPAFVNADPDRQLSDDDY